MKIFNSFLVTTLFVVLSGCASAPKETVELSEVTGHQIAELHKSHIKFVNLYYEKIREDVNDFIDETWAPLFLSKAVKHKLFRSDLDGAYITSSIDESDVSVKWKGNNLEEPQKSVVLKGIKQAVTDEKSKMGQVLLDWSEEAQRQINKKRAELLKPVAEQERLVVNEINGAFLDLQRSQATIKGYLASAVDLKEKQGEVLEKLGALKKVEKVMGAVTETNDKLSKILKAKDGAESITDQFLEQMKKSKESIQKISN
ncbi:hypothetical protein [Neptunomonas antarctica]|uniref:Lipoprotein n=1 Tax=Neptunomonas antarctica TaxID=619304 RepID=A0A1N7MWR0_9GAMM|nr:hypothetical protein [Neptunomonas antarctica]SIS90563.1 hypothetical protein SAMN05421760_10785 [Neptunomonas antarctica]